MRVCGDPHALVGPAVVIDSREASGGALFVALPGENVDGHAFVAAAADAGAGAALVARQVERRALVAVAEDVRTPAHRRLRLR